MRIRKPETKFKVNYRNDWKRSARELLENPEVQRAVAESLPKRYPTVDTLIEQLDKRMRSAAEVDRDRSRLYSEFGLYTKIGEFINPSSGDFVVDLGSGSCYFMRDLGLSHGLNVDINGYALQLGEMLLRKSGRKVVAYTQTYLEFDSEQGGFLLRPHPIAESLDSRIINLAVDNSTDLSHTKDVLQKLGKKATIVTYLFIPGLYPHRNFQFIYDFDKEEWGMPRQDEEELTTYYDDALINNVHKILNPNERLYMGIRVPKPLPGLRIKTVDEQVQERYGDKIEIVRMITLDMPFEKEGVSIKATRGLARPYQKVIVDTGLGYEAMILEIKLK